MLHLLVAKFNISFERCFQNALNAVTSISFY